MDYIPHTEKDIKEMLEAIGAGSLPSLFCDIPSGLLCQRDTTKQGQLCPPDIGKSQQEVMDEMTEIAAKNKVYKTIMRGAGSYSHYIPSVVKHLAGRSEFVTAYTPYQAEMSQGILQAIFEYQTMICNLTGMDVSNASVYSGCTAAADAAIMCKERDRNVVVVMDTIRPQVLEVMKTYLKRRDMEIVILPTKDGKVDKTELQCITAKSNKIACVYLEQPNYFGTIDDFTGIADMVHAVGAKLIISSNPIALAILKSQGEWGADIAVGEGQPLGIPMNFGGPYLGYIACKAKEMRKMPGRIVGQTADNKGRRAFVLTLQAREQHIRRDKALSSICSNEAHCALTASIYLASMGKNGLIKVAGICTELAHYAAAEFEKAGLLSCDEDTEFFHEFVTACKGKSDKILKALDKADILGGLKLDDDRLLWCFTEMVSKSDIDRAVEIIQRITHNGGL